MIQDFQNSFVRRFYLAITLGVIYRGPMLCDFEFLAKLLEIFVFELTSIICDDGGRYTILTYDVICYKQSYNFSISY